MDQFVKSYFWKIKSSVTLSDKYPHSLLYKLLIYYIKKPMRVDCQDNTMIAKIVTHNT